MTLSLAGRRILSCRPEDRAAALHAAIEDAGGTVVQLPLIVVVPPADGGEALRAALARLDRYDWVACTSAAGAAALSGARQPRRVRAAAVGDSTAKAFVDAGWTVDLVAVEETAAGLSRSFPAGGGRVLAILGELAGDDLHRGLEARGYEVETVVAYRTTQPDHTTEQLAAARSCDSVVVSAPSIVERLVALLGAEVPRRAVAYGPRSGEAARAAGLEVVVAASPRPGDVVAALAGAPGRGTVDQKIS